MTTIFRVGQSFVPASIFTPSLIDYDIDNQSIQTTIATKNTYTADTDSYLSTLRTTASSDFYRLFKKNTSDADSKNDIIIDETDNFKIRFDQLAEKRLRQQAEEKYDAFLISREAKLRAEYERLKEIEEYNAKLAAKAMAAKKRDAEKKRQSEERIGYLRGLLFGDPYDMSIPKPCLAILQSYPASFFAINRISKTYYVDGVEKISPVAFGFGYYPLKTPRDVTIQCRIKPRKQIRFIMRYRKWCQQFVRKIIEKRQRGPPC